VAEPDEALLSISFLLAPLCQTGDLPFHSPLLNLFFPVAQVSLSPAQSVSFLTSQQFVVGQVFSQASLALGYAA